MDRNRIAAGGTVTGKHGSRRITERGEGVGIRYEIRK